MFVIQIPTVFRCFRYSDLHGPKTNITKKTKFKIFVFLIFRMLEFLEDIIGTSRFKEPIDILKARVSDLDEHRNEKLTRVKMVEKEKDELEKPKEEALAYLRDLNKIAKKNDILYQLRVSKLFFLWYFSLHFQTRHTL